MAIVILHRSAAFYEFLTHFLDKFYEPACPMVGEYRNPGAAPEH